MSWYDTPLDLLDPGGTRKLFETKQADTSALNTAATDAAAGEAELEAERQSLRPSTGQQDATRAQQQAQLAGLAAAANGTAPSAALIGSRQQADTAFQRQAAMAAAVRQNPAAALRLASTGAATAGGAAAAQGAEARAAEQAGARGLLAGTTAGIRGGDQTAYQTAQQARDNNLAALLKQQQINAQVAKDTANANAVSAGATNTKRASTLGGGAALGSSLLSDARTKTSARDTSMADAVGRQVHGVTFEYKPGIGDRRPHFGVLAHEVERVIPGVVSNRPDGIKEIDTRHLSAANTAMISDLAKRIKELEARR